MLCGRELLSLSEAEMCGVCGGDAAMIFQEPMTSLNPVHTVGAQVAEAVVAHRAADRRGAELARPADGMQVPPEVRVGIREVPGGRAGSGSG